MVKSNEQHQAGSKVREVEQRARIFLLWIALGIIFAVGRVPMLTASPSERISANNDLSKEEKKSMMQQLFAEGDAHAQAKNYNLANAAYESIFLLDPNNVEASQRIDRLKKHMLKEGKSETDIVTHVYDEEIELRTRAYLEQAKQLLADGKRSQARFALQKLLLINPLHEEANKLYKNLKEQAAGPSSS